MLTEAEFEIERLSEELYRLKKQSALGAAGATRNQISLEAEVQTWKDNHGLVVSDRDAWRARAEKAEAERDEAWRWLESLTPGGSEFHRNPIRCVEFVRGIDLNLRVRLDAERARADRYLAAMVEWAEARHAVEKVVEEGSKIPVTGQFSRLSATENAIRAIAEEARRG